VGGSEWLNYMSIDTAVDYKQVFKDYRISQVNMTIGFSYEVMVVADLAADERRYTLLWNAKFRCATAISTGQPEAH
jgi:hypothetical protein